MLTLKRLTMTSQEKLKATRPSRGKKRREPVWARGVLTQVGAEQVSFLKS